MSIRIIIPIAVLMPKIEAQLLGSLHGDPDVGKDPGEPAAQRSLVSAQEGNEPPVVVEGDLRVTAAVITVIIVVIPRAGTDLEALRPRGDGHDGEDRWVALAVVGRAEAHAEFAHPPLDSADGWQGSGHNRRGPVDYGDALRGRRGVAGGIGGRVGDRGHADRKIQKREPIEEVRKQAMCDGMTTLLQDGIQKVIEGVTDFKQVRAVCIK